MRVLLTATVQSHICQFHRPLAEVLHQYGCEVHVAAKDNLQEKNGLKLDFADKIFDVPFSRSPKSRDNFKAYRQLKKIMEAGGYDVVHCNTPMGGIVTRLAARTARKRGCKVYYTAHGFHFYKGAPKINWMIYYPAEKLMSHFTDLLITITKEDDTLAKKKFSVDSVRVHGVGVNESKYEAVSSEEIVHLREELSCRDKFVILCVGELNRNKNQKTVLKAFAKAVRQCPGIVLLLAGNGANENVLKDLARQLNISENVCFLGYRTDLERYTNMCDLVVSMSYREGLPLNIMEAMLCGKPVIASDNRGHRELIKDGETGYLLPPDGVKELSEKILELCRHKDIRNKMSCRARAEVEPFKSKNVISELKKIYGLDN